MYAQAVIKPNTLLRNGAYGIVMRGVQKCTRGCSSLRGRNRLPLCCIKLDTATAPACGSGNFLTETYISIRKLENKAIELMQDGQIEMGEANPVKVGIGQFYGIEINDFAVTVARTALWIAESQMLHETENLLSMNIEFLPLRSYPNITEGNALRIDWESVVPKDKLSYIMGNPPFVGARLMDKSQKDDVFTIFDGIKNNGNLDYVSCWYKKAADLMKGTTVCTALVSTNSITQGEQVAILWKTLFEQGVHIDFAYKTFIWDSEASLKAHVHCVIVGFSNAQNDSPKRLFDNQCHQLKNIKFSSSLFKGLRFPKAEPLIAVRRRRNTLA